MSLVEDPAALEVTGELQLEVLIEQRPFGMVEVEAQHKIWLLRSFAGSASVMSQRRSSATVIAERLDARDVGLCAGGLS